MVSQSVRKLVHHHAEGIICFRIGRSRLGFVGALASTKNPANKLELHRVLSLMEFVVGLMYKLHFAGLKHTISNGLQTEI